jgi:hypothetical protein
LTPARGHVAPSPTENNRYLKITLQPEQIRAAYTVYFGDRPGSGERQRMDANGDGLLDDGECTAFGTALRDQVVPRINVTLDGSAVTPAWRVADVGLGTANVSGGAFAVDLVLHQAVAPGTHTLSVTDGFELPPAGEHEVRVEESPGVRVLTAYAGASGQGLQLRYAFRGTLATTGPRTVTATFVTDPASTTGAATSTPSADRPSRNASGAIPGSPSPRTGLWVAVGLVGAALIAGAVWMIRQVRAR